MRDRFWAVIAKKYQYFGEKEVPESFCCTWDNKHPEDKRKEKTIKVWAIYPRKKDALSDVRFRGGSYVKEIFIK